MPAIQSLVARPVCDEVSELGESPRWDGVLDELLTVDILEGLVFRWNWTGSQLELVARYALDRPAGAVVPRRRGGYLIPSADGFVELDVDGTKREFGWSSGSATTRMNDAACDPLGRLWAGTMPYDTTDVGAGTLYRLDLDGSVHVALPRVTVSNGLAWSSDGTRMYYVDTAEMTVWLFDFDLATGAIDRRRPFLRWDDAQPDGLCRDNEDHLWVAAHGAGEVRRFDPDGRHVASVRTPDAKLVTSCAFGGADGRTLFVTTATIGLSPAELAAQPAAGRIHAIATDSYAAPCTPCAVALSPPL
jgi:sugar lactone lactonase YvrE